MDTTRTRIDAPKVRRDLIEAVLRLLLQNTAVVKLGFTTMVENFCLFEMGQLWAGYGPAEKKTLAG